MSVKLFIKYFTIPKGKEDIRMVYNATARLVSPLCGTNLTKNLTFWYKSYSFVDSIKFLHSL
jgi:hypothetical protein